MRHRIPCFVAVLAVLLPSGLAAAKDRPSLDGLLESLAQVRTFGEAVISPDGQRAAWVERLRGNGDRPSAHSAIFVRRLDAAGEPQRITGGDGTTEHNEHGLAWSPDGRLAFLSDAEKAGQLQLYVMTPQGKARKVTSVTGYLAAPRWSPDGKRLAVLFTEDAPRAAGPLQPATPDAGVVEEKVYEQRLSLIDPDTGRVRVVSPADLYVYEYDWSPDGRRFAAIAAHGSGDNNWYIAQLYTLDADTGSMRPIWKPSVQIAVPRWSPDGQGIAVIGGLMSDEGATGGEIFLVPARGGSPRNLTPGLKASAAGLTWLSASKRLLFTEHLDGHSGLATVDPTDGTVRQLWKGAEAIASEGGAFTLALARDEKTSVVIRQSYQEPPEVWAGSFGEWKPLTHANAGVRPNWGRAENLHWKSDDLTVQGWLLFPRNFDPKRRYPLLVSVHGGPAWMTRPSWPRTSFGLGALASEGYFVLFPNPRGSYGQGEAFTRGNVKDFGYGDLRDILAGVDAALKDHSIDPGRLAIAGWSYGGYMTMWAVTQTNRFRAGVAGAGIANWQSYYGQNGIDQWLIPYFGASVYDDPAVYSRSSPIRFIKRVQTPTLILVGDRDLECPAPQSYEFWHALKTFGVPNQFVVYPNEGHAIAQPRHQRDIFRRTAGWLNQYVRDAALTGGR
jgi:dipeptidyl aminopeptidase/acylaminoacyl peptidase